LIEVVVAVGIFLVVSIGTLSVLGATATGGFQETSPTALSAGRRAKDLTVAAVYLQGLHDYLASLNDPVWDTVLGGWAPGTSGQAYCVRPGGAACDTGESVPPVVLGTYPLPPSAPYQLPWVALRLLIQRWTWDCDARRFSLAPSRSAPDLIVRIHSTLHWRVKDEVRALTPSGGGLARFLPYHASAVTPEEACP
jgi:hypothetical protein